MTCKIASKILTWTMSCKVHASNASVACNFLARILHCKIITWRMSLFLQAISPSIRIITLDLLTSNKTQVVSFNKTFTLVHKQISEFRQMPYHSFYFQLNDCLFPTRKAHLGVNWPETFLDATKLFEALNGLYNFLGI